LEGRCKSHLRYSEIQLGTALNVNDPQLTYTGLNVLETLDGATNYNALLVDLILQSAHGRQRMLDFGAGLGTFSKLLRAKGTEVVCVESDPYLADALVRDGFQTFRHLNEVQDGSFEFIFALNVLEHIEDDLATTRRLAAKLKKHGRLLVYVPAFQCLWTSLDDKLKHYRRYRQAGLTRLARSTGLSVWRSRYADSFGFFAAWAFKILGNKNGNLSARAVSLYDRYVVPLSRRLDPVLGRWIGKNVYIVASKIEKPHASEHGLLFSH
jgi:SAM-dependent methyltransferase